MPRLPLLFVSFLTAAAPLKAAELKIGSSLPPFFADRANPEAVALPARIEFTVPEFVSVIGNSVSFQIEARRIDAISYAGVSIAAGIPGEQVRLLTIGFFDAANRHHNAVLQLRADTWKKTLQDLERSTGLKLGAEPRKVLISSKK